MGGLFVTQASQAVGFGHLIECLTIAEAGTMTTDFSFRLIESDPEAFKLIRAKGFVVDFGIDSALHDVYDWTLLNTRNNDYAVQQALRPKTERLVVIDELGGIKLDCHALINFSLNEEWHRYECPGNQPEFYLGVAFFPLRQGLRKVAGSRFREGNLITVTLGGADRSKTVLRAAAALIKIPGITANYVLGPGCRVAERELRKVIGENEAHRIKIAPDNYENLVAESEYVISSGGNTLYEAAYLGKKILIIWEDRHEKLQGDCFEKAGLSKVIGGPDYLDETLLRGVLSGDIEFSGDLEVDGNGADRIVEIILGN